MELLHSGFNLSDTTSVNDAIEMLRGKTKDPEYEYYYGEYKRLSTDALYAFGEATVPKVTVTLRKSYGGSHIVMACKQLRADLNYAWPSAEIAVMGAAGAAEVLYAKEAKEAEDPKAFIAEKEAEYNRLFANPYQAAKYGYIDDVIEPRNTRFRVIRALAQLESKRQDLPKKKHGNIPL